MSTPYMSGPHLLECEGGVERVIEIKTPHRGIITTIKLAQSAGEAADCEFELYTSRIAMQQGDPNLSLSSYSLGSDSSSVMELPSFSSSHADAPTPRSVYSIAGPLSAPNGEAFVHSENSYPFRNADGTYTVPERKLYVRILAQGAGPKEYHLVLEMQTSLLG